MIEGVSEIGSSPPRKLPIAFVTDTPRRDIYAQSASVIKELLQTRSQVVGVLYNESEKNSEETATRLRDALQQVGITVHLGLLTGPDDVLAATKALIIKGCRLVVIPHDKYALPKAAAVVKLCLEALPDEPIPVFSLDDGVVRDSGVAASVSVSYSILGRVTAELCRQILSGADPASLPVVTLDEAIVFVNQPALQKCRCTLSAATLQRAVVVDTTPSP
jgi:putative ABC transport system substrate-binding protein